MIFVKYLEIGILNITGLNGNLIVMDILIDDNQLLLSDSFLPLLINADFYKFSLTFPVGLIQEDDKIIVTAGDGDFYSTVFEFKISEVINLCVYNARNLDLRKYINYEGTPRL